MDKRFWGIIIALVVIFGGFLIFNRQPDNTSDSNNGSSESAQTSNHTYGEGQKSITLIEYGDFECPACRQFYPILKEIKEKYKNEITFQFRHFPLDSIHPNARAAHRAAEAAAMQDKFWEMHDKLYENQTEWSNSANPRQFFEDYAGQLTLNLDKFREDFASSEVNAIINGDIGLAREAGADSTPTFIFNGKLLEDNPRGVEEFSKLIDEAITQKNSEGSEGSSEASLAE